MSTIKNVIFDLGGVTLGRDFKNYGKVVARCFAFFKGEKFAQCWHDFDRGVVTRTQVISQLAELNGITEHEVELAVDDLFDKLCEIPETVELIKELKGKGHNIYVLSNMPREYYLEMKKFEVFRYVDGAVISSEELLIKPDPRIYKILIDRYNLNVSESLFVDDKRGNVDAALALGMEAIEFKGIEEGVRAVRERVYGSR